MYKLLNLSGSQLVYTLKSGKTLRVDDRKTEEISDEDRDGYIEHLESEGLVKCTKIITEEPAVSPKKSKKQNNEKED